MRTAVVALVLLVAACSSTQPAGSTAQSPGQSSPTRTIAAVSPKPASGCRLPVAGLPPDNSDPARRVVGFVTFPAGELIVTGDGITYDQQTGQFRTTSSPYLYGQDAEAYDSTAGRWVPTTHLLVAPDGSAFAYQAAGVLNAGTYGPSSIHVVDVASASDRSINAMDAYPLAWLPQGVVVVTSTSTGPGSNAPVTLWLLDPRSGSATKLTTGTVGWSFGIGGSVYGTDLNPLDPSPLIMSPLEPGISRAPDRAWRFDISSGTLTTWLYRPGKLVIPAGVDGDGRLIAIVVGRDKTEVWALTAPETGEKIYDGPGNSQNDPLGLSQFGLSSPGIADANGLWLGTATGVVLYTKASGFKLVYPGQATPAGVCG